MSYRLANEKAEPQESFLIAATSPRADFYLRWQHHVDTRIGTSQNGDDVVQVTMSNVTVLINGLRLLAIAQAVDNHQVTYIGRDLAMAIDGPYIDNIVISDND